MGGSSNSTNTSTTSRKILGNTTTSNPFVTSTTNNNGTTSAFTEGSAFDTINNFVNDNYQTLLNNYLNPTIDDTTSQSKLASFTKTLNSEANKSLENNIITPLSNRNMIRSSQATDMYNNLQNSINDSISDYTNELLSSSQENTANMLNNLMSLYLNGYNAINANQAQSLNTSIANATNISNSTTTNSSGGFNLGEFAGKAALAYLSKNPTVINEEGSI